MPSACGGGRCDQRRGTLFSPAGAPIPTLIHLPDGVSFDSERVLAILPLAKTRGKSPPRAAILLRQDSTFAPHVRVETSCEADTIRSALTALTTSETP